MLSAERLRELLDYQPLTGLFYWRVSRGRMRAGMQAGTVRYCSGKPYRVINIGGCQYAHRLAVLYMTGEWPPQLVDHRDTDTMNNSWLNLRCADTSRNGANRGSQRNNKTGLKGVHFHKRDGRFMAQIASRYLGYFDTAEAAHAAYLAAAEEQFGDFARAA